MFRQHRIWLAVVFVMAVQTAALAWMIVERQIHVNTGKEILLAIQPVDPRSLFRGDYVILNPQIARIRTHQKLPSLRRNDEVYVILQRAPNGTWSYIHLAQNRPDQLAEDRVALRGRVQWLSHDKKSNRTSLNIRYGIEKYFVPEGEGKPLEQKVRDRQIRAIVAVNDEGQAAIKGIEVSGQRIIDPPLF